VNWPRSTSGPSTSTSRIYGLLLVVEPKHLWRGQSHLSIFAAVYGSILGLYGLFVAWRQRKRQSQVRLLSGIILSPKLTHSLGTLEVVTRSRWAPVIGHSPHPLRAHMGLRRHQPNKPPTHLSQNCGHFASITYPIPSPQMDTRNVVRGCVRRANGALKPAQ